MNLHYSQTGIADDVHTIVFKYLMNLHYSQTNDNDIFKKIPFKYLMNLHYSQTEYVSTYGYFSLNTL